MTMTGTAGEALRLLVHRQNLRDTCITADPDAQRSLARGQARLRIDNFALTRNTLSYATFGEALKYWQLFPSDAPGFGCVPVWGFATVVDSRAEGVTIGERCFGFWPMGSHLIVEPTRVDALGFIDGSVHRKNLPASCNQVQFCRTEAGYRPVHEARQALLRPLFTTAFLIDDELTRRGFFGARQVLLSSAASKTAYGTALCLRGRLPSAGALRVVGMTTRDSLDFSRSLGCYDLVLPYDDLAALDDSLPTVYIDFSGSAVQQEAVQARFGGALNQRISVGGDNRRDLGGGGVLPGARPTLYVSPSSTGRGPAQTTPEVADPAALHHRLQSAWVRLMHAMDVMAREPWPALHRAHGIEAVRNTYLALLEGRGDPRAGHMLSIWGPEAQASPGQADDHVTRH